VLEVPDVAEPPLMVRGDPNALEQLFLNLLLNAAQALSAGGRIVVSLTADGDGVEVCVRDTGHGIPAALLSRVFDPFVSTKPDGTGLGPQSPARSRSLMAATSGLRAMKAWIHGDTATSAG
jgi:signal transduction histidine kinase